MKTKKPFWLQFEGAFIFACGIFCGAWCLYGALQCVGLAVAYFSGVPTP